MPPPLAGSIPTSRLLDRLPDLALLNHRGETVRLVGDLLAGRAVVITAMYTTCRGS